VQLVLQNSPLNSIGTMAGSGNTLIWQKVSPLSWI